MSEKEQLQQLKIIESIRSRRLDSAEREYNAAISSLRKAQKSESDSVDDLNKYEQHKVQRDKDIVEEILNKARKIKDVFMAREELNITKNTLSEKLGNKRAATDYRVSQEDDADLKKKTYRKSFVELEKIKILRDIINSSSSY